MAENNKTRFFYVLYSDKTRVFDQSERAYYPIYIINIYIYIHLYPSSTGLSAIHIRIADSSTGTSLRSEFESLCRSEFFLPAFSLLLT